MGGELNVTAPILECCNEAADIEQWRYAAVPTPIGRDLANTLAPQSFDDDIDIKRCKP